MNVYPVLIRKLTDGETAASVARLDQLLTAEEVRTKVRAATAILAAQRGESCTWETYRKELDEMEREGFPDEPIAN